MKPGKVTQIIRDDDALYLAIDENGNLLASKEMAGVGVMVNPTREAVVNFKKTLTNDEKQKIKLLIKAQKISVSRVPDFEAIQFSGDFIKTIKKQATDTALPPGTGPLGTRACYMSSDTITMLEKFTAVVDEDPSFDHYVFIKQRE
jgi:hypothetical protein